MIPGAGQTARPGGPYSWEVAVPRGAANLERPSVAKCAEVYTLWKEQLDAVVGTAPRVLMRDVDRALAVALSLRLE